MLISNKNNSVFAREKTGIIYTVWVLLELELENFGVHFETQCILNSQVILNLVILLVGAALSC